MSLWGHLGGGHRTIIEYRKIFGGSLEDYFKFTFVRNPLARLRSAYYFLKGGGFSEEDRRWAEANLSDCSCFEEFCERRLTEAVEMDWIHFRPQWRFVCDRDGELLVAFVGHYEQLEVDFAFIKKRLGIEAELGVENQSPGRPGGFPELPSRITTIVFKLYRNDYELFGYKENILVDG